jgi:hypothetical protein
MAASRFALEVQRLRGGTFLRAHPLRCRLVRALPSDTIRRFVGYSQAGWTSADSGQFQQSAAGTFDRAAGDTSAFRRKKNGKTVRRLIPNRAATSSTLSACGLSV